MVRVHSLAMSGGLLNAVENLSPTEVAQGIAGYRYFGLDGAAGVIEWVVELDVDVNADAVEELESSADQ